MTSEENRDTVNALMVGTGEYTTGYVHGKASSSDKGAGVVALSLFELRRQGIIDELHMAGTNGTKFPGIRRHLNKVIGQRYKGLSTELTCYPSDTTDRDPKAYLAALDQLQEGDVVIVFTPDDTHFEIAMAAVERGCHVLIAKPIVKTVSQHRQLIEAATKRNVIVAMEVHKRWDPIYSDARDQVRQLGHFSFFASYMSQPKPQLETFRAWAGKSSDISYYLNAHHIDFNVWAVNDAYQPVSVTANAATGVAHSMDIDTEDTISLSTQWRCRESGKLACGIYTASWIAPRSDVHSQQRFHYMGSKGEIQIDQAHRGYTISTDEQGYRSANPLFMKYEPDSQGRFAGQGGYGYQSIEAFVSAALSVKKRETEPSDWIEKLATAQNTLPVTAVLEAGRVSLDEENRQVSIISQHSGQISHIE